MPPFNGPNFYHQLGHHDQKRCLSLLRDGKGSGAIISPRDVKSESLLNDYAYKYKSTNAELLIDPQFYSSYAVQEQLDLEEIDSTSAWIDPSIGGPLLREAMQKQHNLEPTCYIIPSPFAPSITDSWLTIIKNFVNDGLNWKNSVQGRSTVIATLAISVHIIEDEESRLKLLNSVSGLAVDGFYIVSDIPSRPSNSNLLYGFLDIIFRLKRNGYLILLGYTEPWAMLAFPFGLDGFASSGLKNRRSFQYNQWGRDGRGGGRAPKYHNFWSPLILDSIRFPDEVELIEKSDLWAKLYAASPYAGIFDNSSPKEIFTTKQWSKTESHTNYSIMMCDLGDKFKNLDYKNRVHLVQEWIASASTFRNQLAGYGVQLRGNLDHYQVWKMAFDKYLSDKKVELDDEYLNSA